MAELNSLLTVGEIARRLDREVHRIEYIIRSRGIAPVCWAGHARVFSDADLDRIASELNRIERERGESTQPDIKEHTIHG